jgi:acyl-CoA synthetase (AMP-forming)/AMP-acid ligase II
MFKGTEGQKCIGKRGGIIMSSERQVIKVNRGNRLEGALPRFSDYLKKWAEKLPEHPAFIYHDVPISYQQLNKNVEQVAKYMLKMGVKKGDRLGYVMNGRPEFFTFYLAASMVGAVIVGMNTRYTSHEMAYILSNCEASHVLCLYGLLDVPSYQERLAEALKECPSVEQVWVVGGPAKLPNAVTWWEIMQGDYSEFDQALREREAEVTTDDPLIIVYTSGSTGQPKGAVLTHRNVISMALVQISEFFAQDGGMKPSDMIICAAPVNHVSGATEWGLAPLIAGCTQILMDYFDPDLALRIGKQYKVPLMAGVPAMYAMMFNSPEWDLEDARTRTRWAHIGGSMAPREILAKMLEVTPYSSNPMGMTETAGFMTWTDIPGDLDNLHQTCGKIAPEMEMCVKDKDGNEVPRGTVGEVCYRGPFVFKEYYKMPEATAAAFDKDGWFYSGDMGFIDENDDLHLVGRAKEMYITGGFNVYPAEIEDRIGQYPGVLFAAVVPIPHKVMGEVGRAYIMPKPGASLDGDAIQAYLKEYLADYKIPRQYVIRPMLPLTALGKIEKKVLRQEVEKEFAG